MKTIVILHGRMLERRGNRYFAIAKDTSLTDRIAAATTTNLRTSWEKIMDSPLGGHVICNQKRADARRDWRMRKNVRYAPFSGKR